VEQSHKHGNDATARRCMRNASMMAGAAFSNSMVGVIHAIGHALGGVCHVPHGDAMTILLPHGMAFNYRVLKEQYGELLYFLAGDEKCLNTTAEQRRKEAFHQVWQLRRKLQRLCGL